MPWERDVDIAGIAETISLRRSPEGSRRRLRTTRDGALFTADWLQALIIEGRGYCAGIGLLSAGEALPATAITTLRPSLWIRVPEGVHILPFYVGVQVEDTGGTSIFEVAVGIATSDVGNGSSSATDYGPSNLRTGSARDSDCIARQEATGDTSADPAFDLWRKWKSEDNANTPATAGENNFEYAERPCPVLDGPATFIIDIGATTAPTVTAQVKWIEFESVAGVSEI